MLLVLAAGPARGPGHAPAPAPGLHGAAAAAPAARPPAAAESGGRCPLSPRTKTAGRWTSDDGFTPLCGCYCLEHGNSG